MSHYPARTVGSHIVDVVINSRLSQVITVGKRKASEALMPSSEQLQNWHSDTGEWSEYHSGDEEDEVFQDEDVDEDSEDEVQPPGSVTPNERRYPCTNAGCRRTYTKPSRLAEHLRSHTGERPYSCTTCDRSYLRESHLRAHARSHLPASSRPLECTEKGCEKRFWTSQHLRVHVARVHHGEKAFTCTEEGCVEAFAKHNQLKKHVAEKHCVPGTKPFQCEVEGCTKSFATTQKLRKHSKVHQDNRYACINPSCTSSILNGSSSSLYFSTWTALQAHVRESHPPTCPYPECNGRIFAAHKGLKIHLKVHEEREMEKALQEAAGGDDRPAKRRRGGEIGRDWGCEVAGCIKTFKSKEALTKHRNVTHLGRRDHVCAHPGCGATFGYKHLLQRHTAKKHSAPVTAAAAHSRSETGDAGDPSNIDWITGKSYASPSTHRNARGGRALVPCPWPDRFEDLNAGVARRQEEGVRCAFLFGRAYDLRRHLKAEHGLVLEKEEAEVWMRDWRERHLAIDGYPVNVGASLISATI